VIDLKVRDIMTKDPIIAEIPGSRTDVLKLLVKHNKTGVPVVNDGTNNLVGFVTRQDLFANPEEEQLALVMKNEYPIIELADSISKAAKILVNENIHHLPVVKNGELVGIVTPADLLQVVENKKIKDNVIDFIRSPCMPIWVNTPLVVALNIIRVTRTYALPVLNDNGRLCGLITDRDIFNLSDIDGSIAISDLGLGEDEDSWTWEGLRNVMKFYYEVSKISMPAISVKSAMVEDPTTVFERTSISEAARIMRQHDYGQLPIRNMNDRLISMIYELDAVAALIR